MNSLKLYMMISRRGRLLSLTSSDVMESCQGKARVQSNGINEPEASVLLNPLTDSRLIMLTFTGLQTYHKCSLLYCPLNC